ncbi:Predicted protein [Mesomycoplasma hyopneumoniae 168]|uniref:Uncharacterized protein n=2 Tax=Mesomycoplasma hyopneumoniae (strain 168) TaxID=907287 RepID=E4QSQ7_MESH1|nr:Predicted protein [Mesomycoplasma hyopneumoniae 168]AGM22034.1 hypothetical protein MHP168L_254 [Mesomycoplasma hyopneumoniae 168-L]
MIYFQNQNFAIDLENIPQPVDQLLISLSRSNGLIIPSPFLIARYKLFLNSSFSSKLSTFSNSAKPIAKTL